MTLTGLVTLYTARLLVRCMEVDPSLITYADIGWYIHKFFRLRYRLAFGNKHRIVVSLLFSLELTATWYVHSTLSLILVLLWLFFSPIPSTHCFQTFRQQVGNLSHSSYSFPYHSFPSISSHTPLFSVS